MAPPGARERGGTREVGGALGGTRRVGRGAGSGAGEELRVPALLLCSVPLFSARFRPASSIFLPVLAATEPAVSVPSGDLSMPVKTRAEGEGHGFGKAGDPRRLLERPLLFWGCLPGKGNRDVGLEGTLEPTSTRPE
ncbi:putative uncharacterized protein FLJ37218 [Papio anubis]|uniref:putative uncharacterized protein FLJ37218 n=1 Tax=Papio anubis TaxID=9555 RepID=UPI0012ADCE56|nr:putative uncharacterized protein FLJ37218 [Papio anubis]